MSSWLLWVLWLLAGLSLFAMLGDRSCQRTQEARVLVSAREMLDGGGGRWLLPTCNGEIRLQKPPLPYWLSAASFAVTGQVNEWAGRLPAAWAAWLTLLLTYLASSRWFSQKAGLLAAGILLTSLLFYQYGRLAETDIYATLFVTAAVISAWRGMDAAKPGGRAWRTALWFAGSGAAAAGATLAKGPPGVFPLLFALLLALATQNWRGLWLAASVALPIAVALAAPWYAYIYLTGHWGVLQDEMRITVMAGDHPGSFWTLIILTLQATLPWSAFWPAALVGAIRWRKIWTLTILTLQAKLPWSAFWPAVLVGAIRWRKTNPHIAGLFCWLVAVFLPLALTANKQLHYVMPALPPLAILCGWAIESAAKGAMDRLARTTTAFLVAGLLVVLAVGGVGAVVASVLLSRGMYVLGTGHLPTSLRMLGIILLAYATFGLVVFMRRGVYAGALAVIGTLAMTLPFIFGPVSEDLLVAKTRDSGRSILACMGTGPLVSRGGASIPLVFATRRVIPNVPAGQLPALASQDATVIVESEPGDGVVSMAQPWHLVWRGGPKGQHFQVFRAR